MNVAAGDQPCSVRSLCKSTRPAVSPAPLYKHLSQVLARALQVSLLLKHRIKAFHFFAKAEKVTQPQATLLCSSSTKKNNPSNSTCVASVLRGAKSPQLPEVPRTEVVKTGPQKGTPLFPKPCLETGTR